MNPVNKDKKTLLLKTGQETFAIHGFTNVGLTELLKKAHIPKGSFYYYFGSKEEYGAEVIRYYMKEYTAKIAVLFENTDLCGKDRLLTYWAKLESTQSTNDFQGQCLIIKLSCEVSDFSEDMRHEFRIGIDQILKLIIKVIKVGQQDGSIPSYLNPDLFAQQLYQQWLGACVLTKIIKNNRSFKTAWDYTYALLNNPI